MLLEHITHWVTGWISFTGEGGLAGRLLDDAVQAGVPLWAIHREGIVLTAHCPARAYSSLRRPARRAGIRLHVTSRHGLPFFLHRYRRRWGLAAGGVLALLLLQLLSGRIWSVTVSGQSTLDEAMLRETVADWGVYVGAPIDALDIDAIQMQALTRLEGIAWLTVNLEGSVAHVELMESDERPEIQQTDLPSNLVASRDGWILSMDIRSGEGLVKPGDAVTAGTLLVSGVSEADHRLLLRRAFGTVIARTERELTASVPLTETELAPAATQYRASLCFFGLDIPLYTSGPLPEVYSRTVRDDWLTADGLSLPLGLRHVQYTALVPQTITRTPAQGREEAVRRLRLLEAAELSAATIQESVYRLQETTDGCVLTGHYICVEDIAREQPVIVEK